MAKSKEQPNPRLNELQLRKAIISLLNVEEVRFRESSDGHEAYGNLRDGLWEILKEREEEAKDYSDPPFGDIGLARVRNILPPENYDS